MDEIPGRPYFLPKEILSAVAESKAALRKVVERTDSGYLVYEDTPLIPGGINAADLYRFLQPIGRHQAIDSIEWNRPQAAAGVSLHSPAGKIIAAFIRKFFKRIRDAICPKKNTPAGTTASVGALTSLAHFIAEHFRLQDEMAKALATSVLVAIMMATKGAFCDVTEEKALKEILQAARIE